MGEQAGETREPHPRAAIAEFALTGHYGTSTQTIAKRVGVPQPYLFRLFRARRRSSPPP
ncbi:TetR family transcriptional regulator [Streptomyces sp. DSM 40750]|uniref:TetR family transcriptional regulator n=1 Tax=Streptomyces sp. DSM 40750 TaxID=2801030 RepID=UPI003FA731C8